jgi:hypothetical protein
VRDQGLGTPPTPQRLEMAFIRLPTGKSLDRCQPTCRLLDHTGSSHHTSLLIAWQARCRHWCLCLPARQWAAQLCARCFCLAVQQPRGDRGLLSVWPALPRCLRSSDVTPLTWRALAAAAADELRLQVLAGVLLLPPLVALAARWLSSCGARARRAATRKRGGKQHAPTLLVGVTVEGREASR